MGDYIKRNQTDSCQRLPCLKSYHNVGYHLGSHLVFCWGIQMGTHVERH